MNSSYFFDRKSLKSSHIINLLVKNIKNIKMRITNSNAGAIHDTVLPINISQLFLLQTHAKQIPDEVVRVNLMILWICCDYFLQ